MEFPYVKMLFLIQNCGLGESYTQLRSNFLSVDRSWARKARGSGPRKRPALLGADFTLERERPSSPSPLSETKPSLSAPEEETKPKEWRQKIESWLQANESDQVTEEQRKTRRTTNRRSLEMDSGRKYLLYPFHFHLTHFLCILL